MQLIDIRCTTLIKTRYFIKCFKRTDSDLIVAIGEIVRTNMKRVYGFDVSHTVTYYYSALHGVAWSVGRSFCRCVSVSHIVNPAKNG